jgi:hypothetical protein
LLALFLECVLFAVSLFCWQAGAGGVSAIASGAAVVAALTTSIVGVAIALANRTYRWLVLPVAAGLLYVCAGVLSRALAS